MENPEKYSIEDARELMYNVFTECSVTLPRGFKYTFSCISRFMNKIAFGEDVKSWQVVSYLNYNWGFSWKDLTRIEGTLGRELNKLKLKR